jgi:hypothetical protein
MSEGWTILISLISVIIGWCLSLLAEFWKEKRRESNKCLEGKQNKNKFLSVLFNEVMFNQCLISSYFENKSHYIRTGDYTNLEELCHGLKTLAFEQLYSKAILVGLSSNLQEKIYEAYNLISLFKYYKKPELPEIRSLIEPDERLKELKDLLDVIIKDFRELKELRGLFK